MAVTNHFVGRDGTWGYGFSTRAKGWLSSLAERLDVKVDLLSHFPSSKQAIARIRPQPLQPGHISRALDSLGEHGWKIRDELPRITRIVSENMADLAALDSISNGRPFRRTLLDLEESVRVLDFFSNCRTEKKLIQKRAMGLEGFTITEPVGVAGLILAYNYPFLLLSWKLGAALAANCPVVAKPSPHTPLSALYLEHLLGYPSYAQILPGDAAVAKSFVESDSLDAISFTGSNIAGRLVENMARGTKRVAAEMGGKNAAVVWEDADLSETVEHVVEGAFDNSGQNCCSISLVYVHSKVYNSFVRALRDRVSTIRLGHPFDEDVMMGPLISQEHHDRVEKAIEKCGLSPLIPVAEQSSQTNEKCLPFLMRPHVFVDVPTDHPLVTTELFGPVLLVMPPVECLETTLALVNRSHYGLVAGVFSKDQKVVDYLSAKLNVGTVWVNTWNVLFPELHFKGRKLSSSVWGGELGPEALHTFEKTKAIIRPLTGASK